MSVRVIETSFTGKSSSRTSPTTPKSERSRSEQDPRQRKLIPQRSRSFDPNNRRVLTSPSDAQPNGETDGLLKHGDVDKECICGPNIYGMLLGPTVDEQILAGLSALFKLCDDCPPEIEVVSDFGTQPSQPSIYESGIEEERQIDRIELGSAIKAVLSNIERFELGVEGRKSERKEVKREEKDEEEEEKKINESSSHKTKLNLSTTVEPQGVERANSGENNNVEVNSTSTGSSSMIVKESADTGSGTESMQTDESVGSTETTHTSASQTEQPRVDYSSTQAQSRTTEEGILTRATTESHVENSNSFKPDVSESPVVSFGKPPSKIGGNSSVLQNVTNYPTYETLRQQSNQPSLDDKFLQRSDQMNTSPHESQQYDYTQSKEQDISKHNSQYDDSLAYRSGQHKNISSHDSQPSNYQVDHSQEHTIQSHNSILKVPHDSSHYPSRHEVENQKHLSCHNTVDPSNGSNNYQKYPSPLHESNHRQSHHTSLNQLPESSGHKRHEDSFHPCDNRKKIKSNNHDLCACCCNSTHNESTCIAPKTNVPVNKFPERNEKMSDFCCGSDKDDSGSTETQESSTSYTCISSCPGIKSTVKIKASANCSCQYDTESTKESSTSCTTLNIYCDKCLKPNALKRKVCAFKSKKEANQNTTGSKNNCRYKRVTACPCKNSTTTTTSTYEVKEDGQNGDHEHFDVRYAITKITKFSNYTTYEVMKSTKKKPKVMPTKLEGVFVLRNRKVD